MYNIIKLHTTQARNKVTSWNADPLQMAF